MSNTVLCFEYWRIKTSWQ